MDEKKTSDDAPVGILVGDAVLTTIERPVATCPVEKVTVYADRAEVTRGLQLSLDAAGDYEIKVEGLPNSVDTDSIRVDGTGDIVLQEVSYGVHHKPAVAGSEPLPDNAELEREAEAVAKQLRVLASRMREVESSKELLRSYATAMLSRDIESKMAPGAAPSIEVAFQLLQQQEAKTAEFNNRLQELEDQKAAKEKLKATIEQRLIEVGAKRAKATITSRDVTIIVTARSATDVYLKLSYLVTDASWQPAYDIRMESESTDVHLTYFGMVRQSTGEDWQSAKLVLSTAKPSVGGAAPRLPQRYVSRSSTAMTIGVSKSKGTIPTIGWNGGGQERFFAGGYRTITSRAATVGQAKAHLAGGGAASTFHIARAMTINSDNKAHKVSVAVLRLASSFRHYSAPAINPVAYLQCLTINTTDYTLLASKTVNVFLNNAFVSKTEISTVCPGETFRTFLGVDYNVKVQYRKLSRHSEVRGYFSRSQAEHYEFVTTIKNNKSIPVRFVMADILPRSRVADIKVKLVRPTAAEVEAGCKIEEAERAAEADGEMAPGQGAPSAVAQLKSTNNLVWSRLVAPGETVAIPFEYAVEYPSGVNVNMADSVSSPPRNFRASASDDMFGGQSHFYSSGVGFKKARKSVV